jgi:hypothetical protein
LLSLSKLYGIVLHTITDRSKIKINKIPFLKEGNRILIITVIGNAIE